MTQSARAAALRSTALSMSLSLALSISLALTTGLPAYAQTPAQPEAGSPRTTAVAEISLDVPVGSRVVPEGSRLEEDPEEMQFLFAVMELIIQDISITKVAEELNRRGFHTRAGNPWGPVAIFNLLPRLVELTPRIFRSEEWVERRKHLTPVF